MSKFITLSMIVQESISRGRPAPQVPVQSHEPSGEDDGIDNEPEQTETQTAEVVSIAPQHVVVEQKPVTIGVDSIRNFYPRKDNVPGTRVVLKSGVAYIVVESHDEVLTRINNLG